MTENSKTAHSINLTDCEKFEATGINEVLSFDENSILLTVGDRELLIEGQDLKIDSFENETGSFALHGEIAAIVYRNTVYDRKPSFLGRLFR